jgi:hypothetical protein
MKRLLLCCALLASGCFRWAPISSLSSIDDDRLLVREASRTQMLVHATAHGRTIEGQLTEGGERVEVDPTEARVFARRLNVPVTTAIIAASTVGVAGTALGVMLIIFLLSSQAVPVQGGGR